MAVRHMAERLGDVNAGLGGAQRHMCQYLQETVIVVVQRDPNTRRWRPNINATAEAESKIVDETTHQIVLADQPDRESHKPLSLALSRHVRRAKTLACRGRSSMKAVALIGIVFMGALLAPSASVAQVACTREGLQRAVDLYVAAQTKGETSGLPLATGLGYVENMAPVAIDSGLIKTAMKIDHHRSLLDPSTCQTFTEVIVTNKEKPYVLGTRLRVNRDKIAEIEILWTTTGYWLFNAEAYLKWSTSEKWDTIPAKSRDTRDTLVSAANAYLDAFLEGKKDGVPWGYPCNRTEGGAHTGKGDPSDSCDVGVPAGVNIANRRFIVDETIGSVVVFCTFGAGSAAGGSGAPDTHLFRVENGKLRYVHTLTHLLQANFRGRGAGGRTGGAGQGAEAPPNTQK